MPLYKNLSGQRIPVYAYDTVAAAPKTGDAANITAQISLDGGALAATNDVNPTEIGGGVYFFDMTQAETNADMLNLIAVSATADVILEPVPIFTLPGAYRDMVEGQFTTTLSLAKLFVRNTTGQAVEMESGIGFPCFTMTATGGGADGLVIQGAGTDANAITLVPGSGEGKDIAGQADQKWSSGVGFSLAAYVSEIPPAGGPNPTQSTFPTQLSTALPDNFFGDADQGFALQFQTGLNAGVSRRVIAYDADPDAVITVEADFPETVARGDKFQMIGYITKL